MYQNFIPKYKEVKMKGLEGEIIIDSYNMDCYKVLENGVIQNCNNKMFGSFPCFKVGENTIKALNCIVEVVV